MVHRGILFSTIANLTGERIFSTPNPKIFFDTPGDNFYSPPHPKMRLPMTRRQFLGRTTAALGSALGVPLMIPASALGRNGLLAPSERITMGFIGVGTQGGGHLL